PAARLRRRHWRPFGARLDLGREPRAREIGPGRAASGSPLRTDLRARQAGRRMTEATDRNQELRLLEAMLFASAEPLEEEAMASRIANGSEIRELLNELQSMYRDRGVNLHRIGDRWAFRT